MSDDPTEEIPTTSMPTLVQDPYIKDHQHTSHAAQAHPLDESIVKSVVDRPTLDFPLASIQAAADLFIDEIETATLAEADGETEYYCVKSDTFYRLAVRVYDEYENTYTEIERLQAVADAHTKQYLADVHG